MHKVIRIELEFDDGEIRMTEGEDAEIIHKAYTNALEFYLYKQKREYQGPFMKVVRERDEEPGGYTTSLSELATKELREHAD